MAKSKKRKVKNSKKYKNVNIAERRIFTLRLICGLLIPVVLYFLITIFILPAPHRNSVWEFIGGVGTFIVGLGIVNRTAMKRNIGFPPATKICLIIGGVITFLMLLIIYNEKVYNLFDEDITNIYFINLLLVIYPAFVYFMFRYAIRSRLRLWKIRVSDINKRTKGMSNFWWYTDIHKEYDLGVLYYINKTFTIIYPLTFGLMLIFGWIRFFQFINAVLFSAVCILCSCMSFFKSMQSNINEYGKAFIILGYRKMGKKRILDSTFFDICFALFHIGLMYAEWRIILSK